MFNNNNKNSHEEKLFVLYILFLRPVVAQGHSVTVKPTGCEFDPREEMKYLFTFIFLFLRSGVEENRDVEFRHFIRNTSRTRQKVGNGVS